MNSAGILMSGSVETLDIADYDKVRIGGLCPSTQFFAHYSPVYSTVYWLLQSLETHSLYNTGDYFHFVVVAKFFLR